MAVNSNELKASVRLDGGAQFKKDIADVNTNLKQLDAESKKVTAEFEGQANSIEALRAKHENLTRTLEQAEKKVQLYDDRIKSLEQQQSRIADSTEEYRRQLEEAQSALSKMDRGTDAYAKQAKAVEDLSRKVALGEQNQERAANQVEKYRLEQTKAETAVEKLNHEIDENAGYLREAENAADQCATSINEYGRKTKQASEETKDLGDVAKVALGNLAADAARKLADEAVDAAKKMVEVGSNFEAAMSKVKAISGATGSDFDRMSAKAKELGSTTKFTATEVADGFSYMSLAGWDTAQMLDAIDGVVNLAAASEMDLGEASDMVTDYLSAFGLAASDAGKMVDMMVFAQSHSNTSTKQLGDAFGNCAANMNAAGQSMETTTAILEAMANQGTKGSEAGTALAAVMRDITSKMKNGAISIGDTSVRVQDAQGNFRSLVDILADVEKATDGMGTAQKASALQSTFTARSIKAVNQVLQEGTGNIKAYESALGTSGGAAATAASTMMDNFKGAVTEASSAAEGLGVAVFEKVSGPLTGVVDAATGAMTAVTKALTPPEKNDLEQYISDVRDRLDETKGTIEGLSGVELSVEADIGKIEAYRDVLLKATTGEKLSEFEKYQLKTAVGELEGVIPGLAEAYDEETGSIDLTTEAMEELIKTTEKQMKIEAYEEAIKSAYKAAADAAIEASEAQSAYKTATDDLSEAIKDVPEEIREVWDLENMDPTVIYDTATAYGADAKALMGLIETQRSAKQTLDEATQAQKDAEAQAESKVNAIKELEKEEEEEQKKAAAATVAQQAENGAFKDAIQIGQGYVNMNQQRAKTAADVTRRTKENADTSKEAAKTNEELAIAAKKGVKAAGDFLTGIFKGTKALDENTEATDENTESLEDETGALEEDTEATEENAEAKSKAQEAGEKFLSMMQKAGEKVLEAAERQEEAGEKERNALETVREAYESNYNSIKNTLNQKLSLWSVFDGGEDVTVEQMVANLQNQTEGIKQYKEEMAAVIAEYGDELGPDLINTLQSMGTDAANTWHHMFVTMSQDNAPELFAEMGKQWTEGLDLSEQIAKYCAGNLTAYQVATNQLGSTKVEWTGLRESVKDMTPELDAAITAAQEAGVQIPDGLADGLASGETTAYDAVNLLTHSLQGTFQGLYEIAEASGADIPDGLSAGMEGSAEEYQAAINTLTESLSQAGNDAGTAAAEEISTGLSDNTDTVETAAEDTAGAAADAADGKKSEFQTAGSTSGSEYSAGIRSRKANSKDAGRQLATSAKQGAEGVKGNFRSVGADMANALAAGIRANQSSAISAAVHMAVEAYRSAKAAIGQRSPTGVFKDELGKNIPLAVAHGISENTQPAEMAAARMARSTFDAARYAGMADMMSAQLETPAPQVTVDTSPIARMLGSGQQAQIVNYITVNAGNTKNPSVIAEQIAAELTQKLRS